MEETLTALGGAPFSPSIDNCISIIQKCRKLKNPLHSAYVHMFIIQSTGLDIHPSLGNYMVPMFVECGSTMDAKRAFSKLTSRDEHSWTSLIQCEKTACAFNLFQQMTEDSVQPSKHTFVALLNSAAAMKDIRNGREIYLMTTKMGYEIFPFVRNALIDMLAKCGFLAEASEVLHKFEARDVVSWTALITGFVEFGYGKEALDCLKEMQSEGVSPNVVTYICSLKACSITGNRDMGMDLHAVIVMDELENARCIENTLVDMYCKTGLLLESRDVFDSMQVHDVVSWNSLMATYSGDKPVLKAFERMICEGICPDSVTFIHILRACGCLQDINKGLELQASMIQQSKNNPLVASSFVTLYTKCGLHTQARSVIDDLQVQDVITWNALISGFADNGYEEEALTCLHQMQSKGLSPDVISWSSVIASFVEKDKNEEAISIFLEMQEQGVLPNTVTYLSILKACGNVASIHLGHRIHSRVLSADFIQATSTNIGSSLIDMYGNCGSMKEASLVFDEMPVKDVVCWNALMGGHSREGDCKVVLALFKQLKQLGLIPDEMTFLSVLTACSHAGSLDEGQYYFQIMQNDHEYTPTVQHYNCMINLFCHTGEVELALAIMNESSFQSNLVTWSTLLGACKKWGYVDKGKHIFEYTIEMGTADAAVFTLMSDILTDSLYT